MGQVEALFIDFDGTLVDSVPMFYGLYTEFVRALGREGSQSEFDELNGLAINDAIEFLRRRYGFEETAGQITGKYEGVMVDAYRHLVKCFEGTGEFLSQMEKGGIRVAIVTSSSEILVRACLEEQGMHVEHVITAEGLLKAKPDPAVYHLALDKLGYSKESVLAVEDTFHGAVASVGAGIETVMITHRPEFVQKRPENVAEASHWDEVAALVRRG